MKKYLLPICLLGLGSINFISCYQDDEEELFNCEDLSISRHTTLTRSGMNESIDFNNNKDIERRNTIKRNKEYPKEENCCYLTVIVERWISTKSDNYFANPNCQPNANDYYQQMKRQLQDANPGWTPGEALDGSAFMDFAEDLTYQSGNTTANYFSDLVIFSNIETSASAYLSNNGNCEKVTAICVEKTGEPGHIAYVTKCNANEVSFKGYDFLGNNRYKMNVNGESGWSIVGVILK